MTMTTPRTNSCSLPAARILLAASLLLAPEACALAQTTQYVFDPAKSAWNSQDTQGGKPGTMTCHCLAYHMVAHCAYGRFRSDTRSEHPHG